MTETEIQMFIETMEDLGDEWTPEQVKTMYGDYTYEAAVKERKQHMYMPPLSFLTIANAIFTNYSRALLSSQKNLL